eukprot:Partr_v1_DN27863_c0_g1_i1_m22540 putative FYVE, RhoGEF and PH domain containing
MENMETVISNIRESAKKLAVISTLYEEQELVALSFQEYVANIMDLLSLSESMNTPALDDLSLRLSLTQTGKDLSSSVRRTSLALDSGGGSDSKAELEFGEALKASLAIAERLFELLVDASRRVSSSSPLASALEVDDQQLVESGDSLEFVKQSLFPSTSAPAASTLDDRDIEDRPKRHAGRFASIYYSKAETTPKRPSLQDPPAELAVPGRSFSVPSAPVPASDVGGREENDSSSNSSVSSVDDIPHSSSRFYQVMDERLTRSDDYIGHRPKINYHAPQAGEITDMLKHMRESRDKVSRLRSRLMEYKSQDLLPLLLDLKFAETFFEDQIRKLPSFSAATDNKVDNSGKDLEIERLKRELVAAHDRLNLLEIRNSGPKSRHTRSVLEHQNSIASSTYTDDTVTREENVVDYVDAVSGGSRRRDNENVLTGVPQTDHDARSVENLLNAIEERQLNSGVDALPTEKSLTRPATVIISNTIGSATLPRLNTISDSSYKHVVAATQIQRIFRGWIARTRYRHDVMRKHIAREIFETEVSYVKGLLVIYKQYVIPLRFKAVLGEPIISKDKIDTLFYQIREIMAFNHTLLGKIERRVQKWNVNKKLGDVFVEYSPNLEMYTHYVNNYNRALATFEECSQLASFKHFLVEIRNQQEKRALGLLDLLITPIQRIPRYILLLKELLKHTTKAHPDYANLLLAISRLQAIGEIINERKRESERYTEILKIQAKISNAPLTIAKVDRRPLVDGELVELTELGKKKLRHVFLFNDILVCTQLQRARFTSSASNDKSPYEFKWYIKLSENQIGPIERVSEKQLVDGGKPPIDDDIPPHAIGIRGEARHILLASSAEDLEKWLQAIADARLYNAQQKARSIMRSRISTIGEKFFVKSTLVEDVDFAAVFDMFTARKMLKERIEQVESDIRVEAKVLYGLQRMNQVYAGSTGDNAGNAGSIKSSKSSKNKIQLQREEATRLLNRLQAETERLNEFLLFIESMKSGEASAEFVILSFLDRDNYLRILNDGKSSTSGGIGVDDRTLVKIFEVKIA